MRQMTDEEKRELGLKIKTARKQKGLSQEQLAELVRYKVGTISKYEQGYRIPDIGMLRKIASALECSISEIAGTTDEVIRDTIRHEEAVDHYIAWLRGVHIKTGTMFYDDDDRTEKYAIIVDVDKGDGTFVPLDIGESINEIMQMSKEHFMLLAKQFGKNVFRS
jgi:transcriptional regulator with XRE-family HTH domain